MASTQSKKSPDLPPIMTTSNCYGRECDEDRFVHHVLENVPKYVLDHAPLVHLNSNENFWPSNLENHLKNCLIYHERGNFKKEKVYRPMELEDPLSILGQSELNHPQTFLTSINSVRPSPEKHDWLVSLDGKPDPETNCSKVSPAILILVDKSAITGVEGTVDAFWFFFYSFNLGPKVAGIHFGNHIADWEHCMIRFLNGKPQAAHLSSHADGFSYKFECLEKLKSDPNRPVIYSARGSHAMYPKTGYHDYSPVKIIGPIDHTDKGPLWDPSLNFLAFQHFPSPARDKFICLKSNKVTKSTDHNSCNKNLKFLACLKFSGQWGDEFSYVSKNKDDQSSGSSDNNKGFIENFKRSMRLEKLRWCDGVTGPRDKDLDRAGMNRFGKHIRLKI